MRRRARPGLLLALAVLGGAGCAAVPAGPAVPTGPAPGMAVPAHPVVPRPARLEATGDTFVAGPGTAVIVPDPVDPRVRAAAERFAGRLRRVWRLPVPLIDRRAAPARTAGDSAPERRPAPGPRDDPAIHLLVDPTVPGGEEAYRLTVSADGVTLAAPGPAGLFYGLQTLDQLVPQTPGEARRSGGAAIAGVVIQDAPRFPYRGLHLDVGRHFFGVDLVKRYLDAMAAYKLNTFHWHLTEDQGWRLEIERYPRLTEVGGCRPETMVGKNFDPYIGDGERYCGRYTQAEAREIVAYARERFITVVPEIEMPGHSLAALAAYPELACTPGPFEVATRWGVFEDIYCPTEATFTFLENVLTEVMDIFPGPYIHVGGDEAPTARWETSPAAQRVIEREGLADEHELQSWFIARIGRFLASHGRRLIGWDEILEGGLPPDATVMSWRGTEGGIEAARQGHDVVMTPTSHLYFDYYQGDPDQEPLAIGGFTPLEQVYRFEPVPEALDPDEARHILGAQGNLWTEYIPSGDHALYMAYPRALALSEVVWSPAGRRDWESFVRRLPVQLQRLARLGAGFRLPDVQGIGSDRLTLDDEVTVRLRAPVPGGTIRYTLDGTDPGPGAPVYRGPLHVRVDTGPVTVAGRVFSGDRAGAVRRSTYRRTTLGPALDIPSGALAPGLRRTRVAGSFRSVDQLADGRVTGWDAVTEIGLPAPDAPPGAEPPETPERFGLVFTGYLHVPTDAVYAFRLDSDDGSALFIDHRRVIDNDGLHGPRARDGQVALAAGLHRIELRYFQAGGGRALTLEVGVEQEPAARATGPGDRPPPLRPVPADWLLHYPRH